MNIVRVGTQHHVVDDKGVVKGKHNSVWSAARQVHEYFRQGGTGAGPTPTPDVMNAERGTAAALQRPSRKTPSAVDKPIPHPHIPRPKK